jgi:hypothetical protein
MLNRTPPSELGATGPAANSPTIYLVAPEWTELNAKLEQLLQIEADLLAKAKALNEKFGRMAAADYFRTNTPPPPKTRDWSAGVKKLLGPFLPSEQETLPETGTIPPAGATEISNVASDLADVRKAISLIRDAQPGAPYSLLTKAHLEGSARLCQKLMPEYDLLCDRICAALVELGQAQLEHRDFMHKHRNAARSMLKPIQSFTSLGDPRDPGSELRRILEWAAEAGHFDRAEIPSSWSSQARREYPQSFGDWK